MDGPGGDADELVNVYIESAALHALLHESATLHHYITPSHHDLRYITHCAKMIRKMYVL